jgi:hypothetical protein
VNLPYSVRHSCSTSGGTEDITAGVFLYGDAIVQVDNSANLAITENGLAPGTYSRQFWTEIADGSFFYCTHEYTLASLQDARSSTLVPDSSDPASGGCGSGSFPWTMLSPPIEIEGRYHSSFTGTEAIDSDSMQQYGLSSTVADYDNETNSMVVLSAFNELYSKIVWTELVDGSFHYCEVSYGHETIEAAWAATETADATEPDMGGCDSVSDFPWTKLSPTIEIEGNWTDGESTFGIDSDLWDEQTVVSYDNAEHEAVTQNPEGGDDSLKYNKVVWTGFDGDTLHTCVVSQNEDTAELAESAAASFTTTDLAAGCNAGPWTTLSRPIIVSESSVAQ